MSRPTDRNRLGAEASPYLRAHADNPVNWQPWDEAALSAARERDVPVFLSIGYSACHWCHVMAEESFEDPEVAERLNERFVPIKVDREERPEIDDIYMTVCQLVRGGGCGWPLSVWLTPEANPFFLGTYFPRDGRGRQPGFLDLLEDIDEQWRTNRADLEERGQEWMRAAKQHLESTPQPAREVPESDLVSSAASTLVDRADREFGGFGTGQKFPQPSRLGLLATAAQQGNSDARDVLLETLDAMARGGLRDHLGGGFHRYCTDREWTVPHFEKMLYDNAGIPRAFLDAYRLTGDRRYADIAEETLEFVVDELRHPEGGFFSSLDARSVPPSSNGDVDRSNAAADHAGRGVEGAYYVWTPETVREAIATGADAEESATVERLSRLFCGRYGVDESGNFEGETVLTESRSIDSLAEETDRSMAAIESDLERASDLLLDARAKRPRPPRDEKVIAGWNGLAIGAFADAALALGETRDAEIALDGLDFVARQLWDGERLARRWAPDGGTGETGDSTGSGDVKGVGYLEDYAFLAQGALQVHGVTGEVEPLAFALDLGRAIVEEFWDPDSATLYYTPRSETDLPVRTQDVTDQALPSSTGTAVSVLLALDAFAPDMDFGAVAERVLRTHADSLEASPSQHPTLLGALERYRRGHLEVTISAADGVEWLGTVGSRYIPDLLLTRRPPTEDGLAGWLDDLGLENPPPIWAGREARDGPTAYVCRTACSPPITDPADLDDWIDEFQGADPRLEP